jgi:two-component system sensor histidine kinase DegS
MKVFMTQVKRRSITLRMLHPPVRETAFWIVQVMILLIVILHYIVDIQMSSVTGAFPTGVPVALLIVPIGYAALRYGMAGSMTTMIWALLLWMPDLLLPHDHGHVADDLMNFGIVLLGAGIFGQRIEAERDAQARVEETAVLTLAVEVGYRRLFESNRSPILVLGEGGLITDANPAAIDLLGSDLLGAPVSTLLTSELGIEQLFRKVFTLADGHDYRIDVVSMPEAAVQRKQLIFEDVTEERSEERQTRLFAQHVLQVDEDQRRQLARELHDEPLQLFLHLARRLEVLSTTYGVPSDVADGLAEACSQALDAAARLRKLARDLRPPALDQLGLAAALSSLVADIEDNGVAIELTVIGPVHRLAADVELGAFRIVQESLRNAMHHAEARHLHVTVGFEAESLYLDVYDDGRGFEPGTVNPEGAESGSLGLIGMNERAKMLGGTLRVVSHIGEGTHVEAVLPSSQPASLVSARAG